MEIVTGGPVVGEATTPTGAVLLRVLSAGPPPARWRVAGASAWGAGGRDPEGYPNALRLILAEPAREAGEVVVLATDLDDLSPEYLEPLREALFGAGALDVQMWATQMKKGRIGFRVEAVVPPAEADRVAEALFRHSTTAGIRRQTAERLTLARRELKLDAGEGIDVRVKVLDASRRSARQTGIRRCRGGRAAHRSPRPRGGKGLAPAGSPPGEPRHSRQGRDPEQGVVTSESDRSRRPFCFFLSPPPPPSPSSA